MARIEKKLLEEMFEDIRAKTKWPIDGDMLWGYFFTDTDRAKLSAAAAELSQRGYRLVDIHEPTAEDDDQELLWLHVERVETHSPETLHRRNDELYRFADKMGLRSYDGMDVGPVGAVL